MEFPVDSYDLKARYAPGLLLALPVLITLWTCFNKEIKEISTFVGVLLSAAITYGLSVIVRAMGKRLEDKLEERWGGFPSTIIVTRNDNTIGADLKRQYLQAANTYLGLPIPSRDEEINDPQRAHDMIDQIFSRIKGVMRKEDKTGLWSIANAEYGFARNLCGSRDLWFVLCGAGLVTCLVSMFIKYDRLVLLGLILNGLVLAACVILGWAILPRLTKELAFRYAEHSWESFYSIFRRQAQPE